MFKFYDLGNDLGETNDLSSDPAFASTIQRMLGELQGHVDRGFTRAGAVANANGTNFQGGDVLDAANYLGYGDTNDAGDPGTLALPKLTTSNPNFIFVDGTAGGRVGDAWIIQGNGEVTFNGKPVRRGRLPLRAPRAGRSPPPPPSASTAAASQSPAARWSSRASGSA